MVYINIWYIYIYGVYIYIYMIYIYIYIIQYIYILYRWREDQSFQEFIFLGFTYVTSHTVSIHNFCFWRGPHEVFMVQKKVKYGIFPLTISGWWYTYTPLKNMSSSVGIILLNIWNISQWEGLSQYMESHKIHVPNHQPDMVPSGNLT